MATILVVDDHPDVRDVVGQMLELHGHQISTAESGESAWEQMLKSIPDAVVVDQRLPGISGMDLLRRIRQSPEMAKVSVVLCSGDDSERLAAKSEGAFDFWLKGSDGMFEAVARLGEKLKKD